MDSAVALDVPTLDQVNRLAAKPSAAAAAGLVAVASNSLASSKVRTAAAEALLGFCSPQASRVLGSDWPEVMKQVGALGRQAADLDVVQKYLPHVNGYSRGRP
jgi:hypothetical protein